MARLGDVSRPRLRAATLLLICAFFVTSCSKTPDSQRATEIFADCLQRNGVEAQNLQVTVDADGSVGGISLTIVSEGDVPYEPTVRLACTQEVESDL